MPAPRPLLHLAAPLTAAALLLPATALATPPPRETATPDQLRAYVSSGAYLTDVQAAVAPARAFLQTRMDEVDLQRQACATAGLPLGTGAVRPAATTTSTAAAPLARAAAVRAATPAVGTTTLTLRASTVRSARVRVTARGGARVAGGRRLTLPVRTATVTATSGRLTQTGTVVLRRGSTRVVLRAIQVRLSRAGVAISAQAGGARTTVLQSTATSRVPVLAGDTGAARVVAAPLRVTRAGARVLRRVGLRAGRVGVITVRVAGKAAAPAPGFVATAERCKAVPSKPAMVLDIDETALSAYLAGGDPGGGAAGQAPELLGTAVALPPVKELFTYARSRGVAVDFITARITPQMLNTGPNLDAQGYGDRIGVTFRSGTSEDAGQYKRDARQRLQEEQGYTILANVGDQCSDLFDGQAERSFKLPNTFYFTAGKMDPGCNPDA